MMNPESRYLETCSNEGPRSISQKDPKLEHFEGPRRDVPKKDLEKIGKMVKKSTSQN